MAKKSCGGEYEFSSLENLFSIIHSEKSYQIQIFSLESVELFEEALCMANIKYTKSFTSSLTLKKGNVLLLKDSSLGEVPLASKILYYSNSRDSRFVPYKFKSTCDEKCRIAGKLEVIKLHKNAPLAATFRLKSDVALYVTKSLNYVQSVILFCMARERTFPKLCREICSVDERLENKFLIQCELNNLVRLRICKRSGDSYSVNLTLEAQNKVYEALGFQSMNS